MHVVVIGLGQVGRHIIRTLEFESHDVVAIDDDPDAVRFIEEHHDVFTLQGYGANERVLAQAQCEKADLVVAVTNQDEVNILAALAAKRMGAKHVIARVQKRVWGLGDEGVYYGLLGVDAVVNPQVLLAREIAKITRSHGALEVVELANARVELVQVKLNEKSRMLHKTLSRLRATLPADTLIAAIVRDGELNVPTGGDVLLAGDRVYLVGLPGKIEAAEDLFTNSRASHRVCIVGGGVVGSALARQLTRDGADVLIIEQDQTIADTLGANLHNVDVVCGDGTDLELLQEEEIDGYDLFAAVTHEDEVNLMATLIAKQAGAKRTLCLAQRPDYMEIYRQLGIDIVLSPRIVASEHILRYVQHGNLKNITLIEDGNAEVIEIIASQGSRAVGVQVRRMNLPRGSLLCAIIHGKNVIIPQGEDFIHAGDTVVILAAQDSRAAVLRFFQQRTF